MKYDICAIGNALVDTQYMVEHDFLKEIGLEADSMTLTSAEEQTPIVEKLKEMNVKMKLLSDGDVSGALMVTDDKYDVDIFLGIGGGPEGVLAASAIDAYKCKFQGRFIFDKDKDIARAQRMGIKDLNKKYDLKEIIKGDSIFCATGITSGDLVNGISLKGDSYITETLVTHKSSNTCEIVVREDTI